MNRYAILARATLLFGLGAACARAVYTCIDPLTVPGACPPDTVKHGAFTITADSLTPADSVVGYVFAQLLGRPIQHAKVTITSDTTRTVFTDSTGRFAAPRPPSQTWAVMAQMIGYGRRADTVRVAAGATTGGLRLQIGLEVQPLDGGCGDYLICTKRP